KQGPCPSCKNVIRVPTLDEQVVIHEAAEDSPKDSTGTSVLKPITRTDASLTRKGMVVTVLAVIGIFALAFAMRSLGGDAGTPLWAQILGLVLLAPPAVWASYSLVYDRELDPYRGTELWQRVLAVSGIFVLLWVIYAFAPSYVFDLDRPSEMSWAIAGIALVVMIIAGAFASVAAFDIEFTGGIVQSGLYFLAAIALAMVAGVQLAGREPTERVPRGPATEQTQLAPMTAIDGNGDAA
ncbi:MAG: hypothetical protein AAF989_07185, partial [Planctomycetota bacterium]